MAIGHHTIEETNTVKVFKPRKHIFFPRCCLGMSQADRPSVSEVEVKITASAAVISRKRVCNKNLENIDVFRFCNIQLLSWKHCMSAKLNEAPLQMEPKYRVLRQHLPVIHSLKSHEGWKFGDPVAFRTSSHIKSTRGPPSVSVGSTHHLAPKRDAECQFPIVSQGPVAPQFHAMF